MTTLPGVGFANPFGRGATLWLFELLAAWTGSGAVTTPSEALGGSGAGGTICAKDVAPPDRDTKTVVPVSNILRMTVPFFAQREPTAPILAGRRSRPALASPCEQAFRLRGTHCGPFELDDLVAVI